jgi:hypothetical protein
VKQTIAHDLPMELARLAARAALAHYQARFAHAHITPEWHGADEAVVNFSLRGFHLKPRIRLRPGAIDVEMDVPFLARPFESRARARIGRELALWLEKAKRGELDATATA